MPPIVIVHYHEIALKGANRDRFEHQLIAHIRWAIRDVPGAAVRRMSGRIVVRLADPNAFPAVRECLPRVFGIAWFACGYEVRTDPDALAEDACAVVRASRAGTSWRTFAVRVKRGNKEYPETSIAMERRIGGAIASATGLTVDLEHPDCTVVVEIVERTAFVSVERTSGPGGLPSGISGTVSVLLSSGFDSPVASWMCMKRGATAQFIHFHSYPYTSDASLRNVREIVQRLATWQGASVLTTVPLIEFQRAVMVGAPHALRVLLYRRAMVRVAEAIAREEGSRALVTGESLGQVASQTLPNIAAVDAVSVMPVLRPLIGFDKLEIIHAAERIGTAAISQRPYDDCCSLFTPAHPETAARAEDLDRVERALALDAWTPKLFDLRSREVIPPEGAHDLDVPHA